MGHPKNAKNGILNFQKQTEVSDLRQKLTEMSENRPKLVRCVVYLQAEYSDDTIDKSPLSTSKVLDTFDIFYVPIYTLFSIFAQYFTINSRIFDPE